MLARIYLGLNTISIGLIGLIYLYDPNLLLARYGLETGSTGMDNMLRAVYGGLFVGVAAIFTLGIGSSRHRRIILAFAALFMGSQAVGRIVSILSVGSPPDSVLGLLYFEIGATILGLLLYLREPASAAR